MSKRPPAFSVIGPGRVGSSLGVALVDEGWRCSAVISGNGKTAEFASLRKRFPGANIEGSLSSLRPDFDVLMITVSDDRIEEVADALAGTSDFSWEGKVVLHASGIVEVDSLRRLRAAGASTGSLHPITSFAARFAPDSARNIYYDFLGDRKAGLVASQIARSLSSKLIKLRSERERALLHIASVVVSNFTVIGTRAAEEMLSDSIRKNDIKPLLSCLLNSTTANISQTDGVASLTGPLARGDVNVIAKHLHALENDPLLLQFYRSASLLGVDLLLKNGTDRKRKSNLSKIKKLLEEG